MAFYNATISKSETGAVVETANTLTEEELKQLLIKYGADLEDVHDGRICNGYQSISDTHHATISRS